MQLCLCMAPHQQSQQGQAAQVLDWPRKGRFGGSEVVAQLGTLAQDRDSWRAELRNSLDTPSTMLDMCVRVIDGSAHTAPCL